MFLTTNRVESIDPAFMSRIHLSLYYPPLSPETRGSIWKSFIGKGNGSEMPDWLNEKLMKRLISYNINGRQIKNTIRMACSIAANEQRELLPEDILSGLDALQDFEADFGLSRLGARSKTSKWRLHQFRTTCFSVGWDHFVFLSGLTTLATGVIWLGATTFLRWHRAIKR
jgi:SpoVK/Ycf46/Vps4 family AAA+-type ATPase